MATKKKAVEAKAAKTETKKSGKKELTAEEKKAKREAMKERLKTGHLVSDPTASSAILSTLVVVT